MPKDNRSSTVCTSASAKKELDIIKRIIAKSKHSREIIMEMRHKINAIFSTTRKKSVLSGVLDITSFK